DFKELDCAPGFSAYRDASIDAPRLPRLPSDTFTCPCAGSTWAPTAPTEVCVPHCYLTGTFASAPYTVTNPDCLSSTQGCPVSELEIRCADGGIIPRATITCAAPASNGLMKTFVVPAGLPCEKSCKLPGGVGAFGLWSLQANCAAYGVCTPAEMAR